MELAMDVAGGETLPDSETVVPTTDESVAEAQEAPGEEFEDVEHGGKKYSIPKPLKGALLMQADYTRKTQEVAEQRTAIEAERARIADEQKTHSEHLSEIARVVAYNDAIVQFEKADWPQIRANNPALYQDLWFQYQQTREARDKAVAALQTKVAERNTKAQQESATRLEEARTAIARDIKDWSPELAGKLNQFAIAQGFTAQELSQVNDPRIVRLIHAAWLGSQVQTKQAAVSKAASVEAARPLPTVGGASPTRVKATETASDKLSTDEWLKRRNAELRQRKR